MAHHVHVEPMDVDCMDSDFDNKENNYQHSNVLPCTEKGYEELDVSELNMKLRYSITPAASPMSKSYSAYVDKTFDDDSVNCNENANLTRSLNSTMTNNDSVIKSLKSMPLQTISTEQFVDNRNSVLKPFTDSSVNNVTIAISGANDNDENVSLPSSSSSAIHTPEATTPTNISKNEEGSPIIRGLKSVFNMFRSSQSPIPPVENDNLVKQEVSPLDETYCEDQKPQTLASTPISAHRSRDGSTSKRSSPLKDSIAFSDDLEKELQWKDDTILFSEEKIPIHKLFLPLAKPMPIVSAMPHKDKKTAADFNSTVEDMDVSYNNSVILDNTVSEMLNNTNAVESDGEFEDCETTITKNESLCVESQVEIQNDLLSSALEIIDVTKEIVKQNESIENESALKTLDIPGDIIVDNIPIDTENEEQNEKMPLTDADMTLDVTRDMVSALIENVVLSNNEIQKESANGALNVLNGTGEIINGNVTDINEKKEPSINTSQRNYVTLEMFSEKDMVTDCVLPVVIVPETETVKCDVPTLIRSGETSTESKLDQKPGNEASYDALHNVTLQSVENIILQGHETENFVIESLNVSNENKAERTFEVCKEVTCLTKEEIDVKQSVESEKTTGKVIDYTQNLNNKPEINSVKNIETKINSDAKELLNATKDLDELKTNLDSNADNSQLNSLEWPHKDESEKSIKASLEDSNKIEENMLFVSEYAAESKETNNINASNSVLVQEPATISLKASGRVIEQPQNLSNEPQIDSLQNMETKVDFDAKELHDATKNLEEVKANLDSYADNLQLNILICPHKNEAEKAIKAFPEDTNKIEENTLFVHDYAAVPKETLNKNDIKASNRSNQSTLSNEPQIDSVQNIETKVGSDVKELNNATINLEEVKANLDSNADNLQLNIVECSHKNEAEKAFLEDSNNIGENTLFVNDYAAEPKKIHNENNINASNRSNQSTLAEEPANISLSYGDFEKGPVLSLSKDKMESTQSDYDMPGSVKIDLNLDVTVTPGKTLNYNNMIKNDIGEVEVPQPEKLDVLNDTIAIVNSLTEIIGESPNNTVSIDIPYTTTANDVPSSPPIRSKGYNFNFDEMDDPFAKKSKIRISPPSTPSKAEQHENEIKKEPEISKKVIPNRRRSQDPERKKPVSKKKFNTTVDAISTSNAPNKSNNPNAECAETFFNVSVDTFKKTSMTKDVNEVDDKEQVLDKMIEENIHARLENDIPKVQLEKKVTPAVDSTIEISFDNKSSIESMTKTTGEIKTSSSENSTYYSAAASSSDNSISKNVFNLPEIDDKNFNPFATKSKMRESPPLCLENENPFASKSKMRSSPNSSMAILPNAENIQLSTQNNKMDAEDKMDTELMEKDTFYNISNTTSLSKCTDDKNITTREVNTEDEDTEEGPFLEAEDVIDKLLDMDDDDNMMQFNEIPAQANEENVDGGELFIDAEAFEFLLNQNKSNVVADSGKESLFLKFDPLFAKTISSGGVLAALNNVQKRQSTPTKPTRPSLRNEASPIAGPSTLNATYEGESNVTQDSIEDLNITVAKPMMVVTPAVNPAVTPRNKTTTPPRSNRRSITFTSPAMAVIDRLLSLSGNNSLMGHDTTITQENREQTEANVALTQLRELLAEKEISVYQLRSESKELKDRLSTMEHQVKILEADGQERLNKINDLNDRLAEKTKANKSMAAVVEEYERTIASLIAETEQDRKRHAEERVRLINERDEQTAHLASMEVSFSDLHSKYEKSKQVILSWKAHEETCKKSIKDFEVNLTKMQTNYEMLKQHATSKLNHSNQELQKMNKTHESEVLKLNALIKRKDMHITSLEETLTQKTKANEELTAICDELINKVG